MTFKHVKFEDSAVMRSLEKLAKEKGWVKEEPITKSAYSKVDLHPSISLTENILHLCAGLRASGFEKHAADLETKYMVYKQAQTLYETTSEKGEDLVDRAHPKGSHKLEDVDSDEAVFETILDHQLKTLKMVEKEPTGKLASSNDVLKAVKIVFAQSAIDTQKAKLKEITNLLVPMFNTFRSLQDDGDFRVRTMVLLQGPTPLTRKLGVGQPVTPEDVQQFLTNIKSVRSQLMFVDPNSEEFKADKAAGWPKKLWIRLQNYDAWVQLDEYLKQWEQKGNEMASLAAGGLDAFVSKLDKQLARLAGMKSLLKDEGFTDADRKQGSQWIAYFERKLNNWKSIFTGITDPDQKAEVEKQYEEKLNTLIVQMNQFSAQMNGQAQG